MGRAIILFEYSKNPGFPILFFPKLAALRKEFPWRPEMVFSRKPDLAAAIFSAKNFLARCLLHVVGQFRSETGGGSAVFDTELWINSLEMFSDSRRRNSQD